MNRLSLLSVACLLAVAITIFFANLGGAPLFDDDEGRNSSCGREMLERNDWIVPTFNHELRTQKPVLLYWLMMLAYQLFGVSEFAARLPSAVTATGTVLLTYLLGARLFTRTVGLWAGVLLATSVMFDVSARAATPDSTLIFFTTLSVWLFVRVVPNSLPPAPAKEVARDAASDVVILKGARWYHFVPTYAAMGMAVMAKGPVGAMLPTAVLFWYVLLERAQLHQYPEKAANWRERGKRIGRHFISVLSPRPVWQAIWLLRPWVAVLVVGAIALPWYVAVGIATDGAWLTSFLGKENLGRFLAPMEGHRGPIFYYVIAIIAGFFPASIFLTLSLTELVRNIRRGGQWNASYLLASCWAATYIAFFSLARTKLPSYVLPAYPALAIITAAWVEAWLADPARYRGLLLRAALGAVPLVGIGIVIVLPIVAHFVLPGEGMLGLFGLLLVAGGAYVCWQSELGHARRAAAALALTSVLFSMVLFGYGAARVGSYQNSSQVVATARRNAGGPVRLATFDYFVPSLAYYAADRVDRLPNEEAVARFFREAPHGYLVTRDAQLDKLVGLLPHDVSVLSRQRRFLRTGEVVVIGRPAQTVHRAPPRRSGA